MKKKISLYFVVIFIVMSMCGCSNKNTAKSPFDIAVNGETISYADTRENAEKILGKGEDSKVGFVKATEYNKSLKFVYTDDKIRCIEITDSDVVTYNGIAVDTQIKDVLKQYKFEQGLCNAYSVAFIKGNEVDIASLDASEPVDCWLIYFTEDEIVSSIQNYDSKYAKEMR